MSPNDGGGSAPPCGKKECLHPSVLRQGHQMLCAKHYRFGQMRSVARRDGKYVPSHDQLHELLEKQGMACSDCGMAMNWRSTDGRSTVLSLQHYRDGSIAFACLSCNTRHAYMPGDAFRGIPSDHKLCPSCEKVKPSVEFTKDHSRSGALRRKSLCRMCSDASVNKWKESNRDQYNQYQRAYRAKRKSEGNPVRGGG